MKLQKPTPARLIGALLLTALAACQQADQAPPPQAEQSAVKPIEGPLVFAEFIDGQVLTKQGTSAQVGSYSQHDRDKPVVKAIGQDGNLIATGTLSNRAGSTYGGIVVTVPAAGEAQQQDLSAYSKIKLQLASSGSNKSLQVRLTGDNGVAVFRGCYPFALVEVTEQIAEYTIPLDDAHFPTPSWCKDLVVPVGTTLKGVRSVDIVDAVMPASPNSTSNVEIVLGNISFER